MYSVPWTVYSKQYILYSLQCTRYILFGTVNRSVQCVPYTLLSIHLPTGAFCQLFTAHCTNFTSVLSTYSALHCFALYWEQWCKKKLQIEKHPDIGLILWIVEWPKTRHIVSHFPPILGVGGPALPPPCRSHLVREGVEVGQWMLDLISEAKCGKLRKKN